MYVVSLHVYVYVLPLFIQVSSQEMAGFRQLFNWKYAVAAFL